MIERETADVITWLQDKTHLVKQRLKAGNLPECDGVKMVKNESKDDIEFMSFNDHY